METNRPIFRISTGIIVFMVFVQFGAFGQSGVEDYFYTGINGESHIIKVYFPNKKPQEKAPCTVFFHGGAAGQAGRIPNLEIIAILCRARRGQHHGGLFANRQRGTSSSARGKSRNRDSVIDAKTVIRWVKKNAETVGIDPERIIAGGGSSGRHIATLATVDNDLNHPKDPMEIDTNVKVLLLFCPPSSTLSGIRVRM